MRIAHSLRTSAKSSLYIRARLHAGEEIEKKCFRPKLPAFRTFRKRLARQRDLESARENISRSCCRAIIGELLHETLSREKWAACASISSYFFFFFFYLFFLFHRFSAGRCYFEDSKQQWQQQSRDRHRRRDNENRFHSLPRACGRIADPERVNVASRFHSARFPTLSLSFPYSRRCCTRDCIRIARARERSRRIRAPANARRREIPDIPRIGSSPAGIYYAGCCELPNK